MPGSLEEGITGLNAILYSINSQDTVLYTQAHWLEYNIIRILICLIFYVSNSFKVTFQIKFLLSKCIWLWFLAAHISLYPRWKMICNPKTHSLDFLNPTFPCCFHNNALLLNFGEIPALSLSVEVRASDTLPSQHLSLSVSEVNNRQTPLKVQAKRLCCRI